MTSRSCTGIVTSPLWRASPRSGNDQHSPLAPARPRGREAERTVRLPTHRTCMGREAPEGSDDVPGRAIVEAAPPLAPVLDDDVAEIRADRAREERAPDEALLDPAVVHRDIGGGCVLAED